MRPPASACPQCSSADCGPVRCRFTMETHAMYLEREASIAMIKRTLEAGGYLCECPGWWNCPVRGCYERAKHHADTAHKPQPGDAGYLSSSSRSEDSINQSVYYGGPLGKRSA